MVKVRLPDGTVVEHPQGTTAGQVVEAIGPGLARKAVAAKVNGEIVDLARPLTPADDQPLDFAALTLQDDDGLWCARHSAAHVMAEAICTLWPEAKLVYGPPVENGFYYDIDLDRPIKPEDFPRIEAEMKRIAKEDRPFTRVEMSRSEAMPKLADEGNEYKIDNAERAEGDVLSFYVTGEATSGCFEDLCRGPHVPSSGRIGSYKVMQVAGAYHHGDASKKMLQRVYGTAFPDKKALNQYLHLLEEAKKRDHRRIGQEMGLFVIDQMVGPGMVLWKPRGAIMRRTLEEAIWSQLFKHGYQPVYSPHIGKLDLYRTSGHFPYYKDSQFPPLFESEQAKQLNAFWELTQAQGGDSASPDERARFEELAEQFPWLREADYPFDQPVEQRLKRIRTWLAQEDGYLLKPMNCPHHVMMFKSDARSYRDLPVRLAEFGTVYRYEQSGELSGMTRVRCFTQDDAHVFCTPEQLHAEIEDCIELSKGVLEMVGLTDYRVRVSLRDPDSSKYIGDQRNWDLAEAALREAVRDSGMTYSEEPGEAAFYGPKIDFVAKDAIGREWQLGTVQVDYNLPERFGLEYVGEDNTVHRPIMVHRALLGSVERFAGILIEHFAGKFPVWLAPVQVAVATVSDKSEAYAREVFEQLKGAGIRVELDDSSDRIGAKIRRATLEKTPYILVIGEQEAQTQSVNVRTRDGQQMGNYALPEFLAACAQEIANRGAAAPGEARQASPV